MPHVASPTRLLTSTLATRRHTLEREQVEVTCDGRRHHLRFDGRRFYASDHDEAAEAALRALGGAEPLCLRVVAAADAATPAEWWATLDPRTAVADIHQVLRVLPEPIRRTLLAGALEEEFVTAAPVVRDSVAQLGLALLGEPQVTPDLLRTKFQLTREFPRWDPGAGPWSDKELVLLARCMRSGTGEARPHLVLLPTDPLARQAVAKYAVGLLDPERFLNAIDLRTVLSSTHRNVKALTSLLVREGLLVERDGQYRVRPARGSRPGHR